MKRVTFFLQKQIIALAKSVETFFMVPRSDIPTVKYWKNFGSLLDKAKEKIPKKPELMIHISRHWKQLELMMIWAVNGPRAYPVRTPLTARPGANTRTTDANDPSIHALDNCIN